MAPTLDLSKKRAMNKTLSLIAAAFLLAAGPACAQKAAATAAAADLSDLARVLPRQREPGMKCENRDVKPQAGKASWQIACSSADGSLAGPAEVTFAATSYAGKAELERRKKGAKAEKVSSV